MYWQVNVKVTVTATNGKSKNKLEMMVGSYVVVEIAEIFQEYGKKLSIYFHILKMTVTNSMSNSLNFSSAHSLRYAATKHTATRRSD